MSLDKKEVAAFMLESAKQLVFTKFDKHDRTDKQTIIHKDDNSVVDQTTDKCDFRIFRSCFPPTRENNFKYFEDYSVYCTRVIENTSFDYSFYLEWKNNDMDSNELVPIDFNPRKIKKRTPPMK